MKAPRSSSSSATARRAREFEKVLEGATPAERERAAALFHSLLSGDPASFPVQLALVTRASLEAAARAREQAGETREALSGSHRQLREILGDFHDIRAGVEAVARSVKETAGTAERSALKAAKAWEEAAAGAARSLNTAEEAASNLARTRAEARAAVEEVAALLREQRGRTEEINQSVRAMGRFREWASTALMLLGVTVGLGGGWLLFGPLPGAEEAALKREREWEDYRDRMERRDAALEREIERLKAVAPAPVAPQTPAPASSGAAKAGKAQRSGKSGKD